MHILLLALLASAFVHGEATVTRAGKPQPYALKEGKLETSNGSQILTLSVWRNHDVTERLQITLVVNGPGTYKRRNIMSLAVVGADGDSIFRGKKTDCTFTFTQTGRQERPG